MRQGCVSVIVPVYNQEHCIEECLNSILCQSYSNLQILIIDDGSTDKTPQIIDEYSKNDSRIEVYHLKNKGVSETRNYGIYRAYGEYIQFVDSDDMIKNNMTEYLINSIVSKDTDMAICNYVKKFGRECIPNENLDRTGIYSTDKYFECTLKNPGHHYYGVVWNKLYKTEIIKKYNILFDKNVTLGEDFIFNINYWKHSRNVAVSHKYLYIYSKSNSRSLSNKVYKTLDDCISELDNRKIIFDVYKDAIYEINKSDIVKKKTYQYWITFYVRQVYSLKHEYLIWDMEDRSRWDYIIKHEAVIKESFEHVSPGWVKCFGYRYRLETLLKSFCKGILGVN